MHDHEGLRARPIEIGVGVELWDVYDRESRDMVVCLSPIGTDEELPCEQVVPRVFRDDPDGDAVIGIRTGETVLDVQVASL
jgi:hypothetical protein